MSKKRCDRYPFKKKIEISKNNIFLYSDKFVDTQQTKPFNPNTIPNNFSDPLWSIDSGKIELKSYYPVLGNNGNPISIFLLYQWGKHDFCIPTPIKNSTCMLGFCRPSAHFFNEHFFDRFSTAKIFYFQDMRVAFEVQNLLDKMGYDPRKYFVTSSIGYDLSPFMWNFFTNHHVVFVPSPTPKSLACVRAYERACMEHGAENFLISNDFILRTQPRVVDISSMSLSSFEDYIVEHSQFLNNCNSIAELLDRIANDVVTYPTFRNRYSRLGLFKISQNELKIEKPFDGNIYIDPRLTPPKAFELSKVSMNHILRPESLIMVSGLKDAGKTQVSYLLCRSALQIESSIPTFSNASPASLGNICIVDAETPLDEMNENLKQHGLDEYLHNKLFIFSRFDGVSQLPDNFDLTDTQFREILKQVLIERNCRMLILDNLTALMGEKIDHSTSSHAVIRWAEELQKLGICVVFILHKAVNAGDVDIDRNRGSRFFKDRARTIINLIGKNEILTDKDKEYPDNIISQAKMDELIVGLQFTVCKTAPIVRNKTLWIKLPFRHTWEFICMTDTSNVEIDLSQLLPQNSAIEVITTKYPKLPKEKIVNLPSKEMEVLVALVDLGGDASIGQITPCFEGRKGMKEDTIRNLLGKLAQEGLVMIEGNSSRTRRYVIPT